MDVGVELVLCVLAGVAVGALAAILDRWRTRRAARAVGFRFEPVVEDAWHCPMCHFLAMLKRSEYGREWRANILAAIDRGSAPAHGPLDHVMREAPPLDPRPALPHEAVAGGGQPRQRARRRAG